MPMTASGAGQYGSIGTGYSRSKMVRPAAGNSKLMAAGSISAVASLARSKTEAFIAQGKKMAQGAAGNSKINVKA